MFVTKRSFNGWVESVDTEHRHLNERYWELRRRHERLLEHLGLNEVVIREKTILEKKGGPEHD